MNNQASMIKTVEEPYTKTNHLNYDKHNTCIPT